MIYKVRKALDQRGHVTVTYRIMEAHMFHSRTSSRGRKPTSSQQQKIYVRSAYHVLIYGSDLHSKNGARSSKVVDISVLGSSRRVQWHFVAQ